ncbi:FAD binding domain-containing protein [Boletus edulis BED1]|uniref:FAD binding domain-containing protein n=1 Tax=Boletus edulis BED1 TaxID=1328754 RepID=A0AAD4GL29_BOLED|nr:FAD binding domain-containing protein [Boletus edulis BED1]
MPPVESRVDVLVVGAGPAGIMCANALAMAGTDVRIIDKRPIKVAAGQADGIQPRTIEVLQSYGLAERLIREGNQMHMCAFYNPGRDGRIEVWAIFSLGVFLAFLKANIKVHRTCPRCYCTNCTLSVRGSITLHQGAIEAIFLDSMKEYGLQVERPRKPVDIQISEDVDELSSPSSYPVKVTVERLDAIDEESKTEIIHAKFVVGADGAHSWIRKALGIVMEGEQTDYIWGVVDTVPETNFPDIRNRTVIHSENGSCMVIPREGDTVRLYIQLSDKDVVDPLTGRVDKNKMSPQKLLSVSKKIFQPYELADSKGIEWWTIYIIGQRVASSYSVKDRVFIAGDACHTHSPKAGQGMNASMNDTHNLAWKLSQVLRGWTSPSLLKTYEHERRKYAQDLINFDKEFASLFSGKPRTAENEDGVSHEEFLRHSEDSRAALESTICRLRSWNPKHQQCAEKLVIGQRMLPQIFVRAADIRPMELHDLLPSDVRFKVLLFPGYLTEARVGELGLLAEELSKPSSFLKKHSHDGNVSTVFDIITIAAGSKEDINYLHVPQFFRSHWTKVLLDDTDVTGSKGGHGYERFGIDPKQITLVVVRPDGYVGTIVPSTAIADLDSYFGSFLLPRVSLDS